MTPPPFDLLLAFSHHDVTPWRDAFARALPEARVHVWPDTPEAVDVVAAWRPPAAVFDHDASWRVLRTTLLVGLYMFLVLWGLRIASQAKDRFGAVCAVGVSIDGDREAVRAQTVQVALAQLLDALIA